MGSRGYRDRRSVDEVSSADGIEACIGFDSAGTRINVVAIDGEFATAILCDHHESTATTIETSLRDHQRLARAGWSVHRIPHRTSQRDFDTCLSSIRQRLQDLRVQVDR